MLVSVDVVWTIGFLGFVFAVLLLICLFVIIGKLSGIQTALRGILTHQRFANAWPVHEHGRWTVLDRTFSSDVEARAFIAEQKHKAARLESEPPKRPPPKAPPSAQEPVLSGKSPLHEYEQEARRRERRSL